MINIQDMLKNLDPNMLKNAMEQMGINDDQKKQLNEIIDSVNKGENIFNK